MNRMISKIVPTFLVIVFILHCASSNKQERSGWKKVVADFTSLAKQFGLEEANESCIEYLRDDNTCLKNWKQGKLWRVVEENRIPILECNAVSMGAIHHACELKTWFVILIIILIIIFCLSICCCICCCALWLCNCCSYSTKSSKRYH